MRRILFIGSNIGQGRMMGFILARPEYSSGSLLGDVDQFILRLKEQSDRLCRYLWTRFSDSEQRALERDPDFSDRPDIQLSIQKSHLCSALNRLINGPPIYKPKAFDSVKLSTETRSLIEQASHDAESLATLNRSLLDDAFPLDLKRRRTCTVTIEPNQENAEAAIAELRPHLIFFDQKAPTIDGLALAQWLRREGLLESNAFVFISHMTEAFPELSSDVDGFPILYWPYPADQLRDAAERVP